MYGPPEYRLANPVAKRGAPSPPPRDVAKRRDGDRPARKRDVDKLTSTLEAIAQAMPSPPPGATATERARCATEAKGAAMTDSDLPTCGRFSAAQAALHLDAALADAHPEIELRTPHEILDGKAGLRTLLAAPALEHLERTIILDDITDAGERAAALARIQLRPRAANEPAHTQHVGAALDLREGRVIRWQAFADPGAALAGAQPTLPHPAIPQDRTGDRRDRCHAHAGQRLDDALSHRRSGGREPRLRALSTRARDLPRTSQALPARKPDPLGGAARRSGPIAAVTHIGTHHTQEAP